MPTDQIHELCAEVNAAELMAHVQEFARRMKLSGTPDELESLKYVQSRLDSLGFATQLILHDAYISLPKQARLTVGGQTPKCITHSFSQPSAPGGTTGEVVYLGVGSDADFAKTDVRGKIALLEGIANPGASLRASRAGAIGQIHISPHEHIHEMCISPVWGSPTDRTRANLPTTVVVSIALADGAAVKEALHRNEPVEATLEAAVDTGWRKTPILVAEMASQSGGADEPFVMFSGHHDTWYYGVMDNGTANATMLEVARVLGAARHSWKRGLRLCFWSGHSHGRYSGSTWYADNYWDELNRRCAVHVNVDSTGARGNVVLEDAPSVAELRNLAREAIAAQGEQELAGQRMSRAGDQSFWGVGIPSMYMSMGQQSAETGTNVAAAVLGGAARRSAGLGWWWHTPDDLIDKIEPDLLVRDTRIYVHTITRLLQDAVVPLDYADYAAELIGELTKVADALGDRFDVAGLIERARTLQANAGRLGAARVEPAAVNAALMALSRALVPIEYTNGDRFDHDPALGQSPCPSLDPMRRLATAAAGSDEAKFLIVAAVRGRNRVMQALDEANAIVAGVLAEARMPELA